MRKLNLVRLLTVKAHKRAFSNSFEIVSIFLEKIVKFRLSNNLDYISLCYIFIWPVDFF